MPAHAPRPDPKRPFVAKATVRRMTSFVCNPSLADPAHARLEKVILGHWGSTLGLGGVG
jgi:hypothetical protein